MLGTREELERWIAARRGELAGGGIGLDGGEPGRMEPGLFDAARVRVLIARLSSYRDVLHSITHRMLYWAARNADGAFVDLAFWPPPRDAALMARDGVPWWFGTASRQPPARFDVVAISLSVQQEALNLPAAMRRSGLKLSWAARAADARHPLVLLGGNAAGAAPFLHGDAEGKDSGGLVDAVCFGDGLTWLPRVLSAWAEARATGMDRPEFLARLARDLPGTYVPAFYRHEYSGERRAAIRPLRDEPPARVTYRKDPAETWMNGYDGAFIPFSDEDTEETLPLAAGCAYRCRFCQTGWMRGSLDVADPAGFLGAARRLRAAMAASDLNLLASDACSIGRLAALIPPLQEIFPRLSVKSLSLFSLAHRGDLRALVQGLDKREFTFGVEGVSARLRAWLGKPVSDAELEAVVRELAPAGLRRIKLFFIATGREESADWAELTRLLGAVRAAAPGAALTASFTPLFHAPFTPLQFAEIIPLSGPMIREAEAAARAGGAEFRWSAWPDEIQWTNLLCRLGRAATPLLVKLSLDSGLRYDEHLPPAALQETLAWLRDSGRDVAGRMAECREEDILPWDDFEGGTPRERLWRQFLRASNEPTEERAVPVSGAGPRPSPRSRKSARPVVFLAWLPPPDAARPGVTLARALLRDFFAARPDAVRWYAGSPELIRPFPGHGLAFVRASFFEGWTPGPAEIRDADGAARRQLLAGPLPGGAAPDPDECVFAVRFAGDARAFAAWMRRRGVPFQDFRNERGLWSVVPASRRHRSGLLYLLNGGSEPSFLAAGLRLSAFLGRDGAALLRGAELIGVYGPPSGHCPACGAAARRALVRTAAPLELCEGPCAGKAGSTSRGRAVT
ncbi:MAG TPA: hypothetical protein P5567_07660 [Kiritimatiellia bacterium]|nr:hypothetical protein [Kiritimatiellia bacterium]HRZ12314.1 hypothetical protein [Kiritimatiellia bacterium]HSA17928.1 hypothetical protein [Kiritimatiellia bacterium]